MYILYILYIYYLFQSAHTFEYQSELSKHGSQTDGSKGFGGRYGVQTDSQDKTAGSYDDMQEVRSSERTDRGGPKGQAGSIRARFEKMSSQDQEVHTNINIIFNT